MTPRRSLTLLLSLVCCGSAALAGCDSGSPAPTATPTSTVDTVEETPDPSIEPTVPSIFPTSVRPPTIDPASIPTLEEPEDSGARPGGIGTLVAEGTADPDLPTQFTRVELVRTGGPTDESGQTIDEVIVIESSGGVSRNGAQGQIDAASIAALNDVLNSVNLFAVQANFMGPVVNEGPVPYMYQLTVTFGPFERLISGQDGFIPAQIQAIIATVLQEGFKVARP